MMNIAPTPSSAYLEAQIQAAKISAERCFVIFWQLQDPYVRLGVLGLELMAMAMAMPVRFAEAREASDR